VETHEIVEGGGRNDDKFRRLVCTAGEAPNEGKASSNAGKVDSAEGRTENGGGGLGFGGARVDMLLRALRVEIKVVGFYRMVVRVSVG